MEVGDDVRLSREFLMDEPEWTGDRTGWRITHFLKRRRDNIRIRKKGHVIDVNIEEIEKVK